MMKWSLPPWHALGEALGLADGLGLGELEGVPLGVSDCVALGLDDGDPVGVRVGEAVRMGDGVSSTIFCSAPPRARGLNINMALTERIVPRSPVRA